MAFVQQDSVFKTTITHQGNGEVVTTLEQKDRGLILDRNQKLRNSHGVMNDLSFGRQIASIPFEDWEWFKRANPDYHKVCKEDREKMLFNFLKNTPRGQACMIVDESHKKYHTVTK